MTFLFATGAGAPSTHPWMQRWAALLGKLGRVHQFDFPYLAEGRRRPDPLPMLIEAHRKALNAARREYGDPIALIGKSMGSRVGCHLSLEVPVSALVCLGYPLCGGGDRTKLRDQVIYDLRTSVLFVQGTRDTLCPLDILATVRSRMTAPNELFIVDGGDHSLEVTRTQLKKAGEAQNDVDLRVLESIRKFVNAAAKH
jgi:predicted alpha/beta-hydrolase family hydrolase